VTHYTTLVQRCRRTNSLLADEIDAEFRKLEQANDELVRGMTEMAERYTAAMDRKNARIEELRRKSLRLPRNRSP
jgi:uncharacterized protein YPO0396